MTHQEFIKNLIKGGYLKRRRIIAAFKKIDRKNFVPQDLEEEVYINTPLPIGWGQTISQPATVAFMIELLEPEKGNIILDVGAGSGWQTALLAEIVGKKGKVIAMELLEKLAEFGKANVEKYNFLKTKRVEFIHGDAEHGLPDKAPFDRIIAAASAQAIPEAWKKQLKVGGRIVAPVGNSVTLLIKKSETDFEKFENPGFAFVPFVSAGSELEPEWKKHFKKPQENV
jgi:protein-L-isoaspartate(D-aspartate) O-methyltransferase